MFMHYGGRGASLYVINTVGVFHPKCPLTTVRSRFSAEELQIVRVEAESKAKSASNGCNLKRTLEEKSRTGICLI